MDMIDKLSQRNLPTVSINLNRTALECMKMTKYQHNAIPLTLLSVCNTFEDCLGKTLAMSQDF